MWGLNVFLPPRTGFDKVSPAFSGVYPQPFNKNSAWPAARAGALVDAGVPVKPGFTLTGAAFPPGWWNANTQWGVAPSSRSNTSRKGMPQLTLTVPTGAQLLPTQILRAGNGGVVVVK